MIDWLFYSEIVVVLRGYFARRDLAADHLVDAGCAGAMLQPLFQRHDLPGSTAGQYFYSAVGQIAGIAAESESLGFAAGAAAEPDSLDAPVDSALYAVMGTHAVR